MTFVLSSGRHNAGIVSEPGKSLASLPTRLREFLPVYMIPADYFELAELPFDTSEIPERDSLLRLTENYPVISQIPPSTAIEKEIALIWSELLGTSDFGVNESFFELGGHSLMVTRMVARIRTRLNVELQLQQVFDAPTIAQIANSASA